jgi:transposase
LSAYEQGEGTLEELAQRFMVSLDYGKKLRRQFQRTGQMDRVEQVRGTPRRLLAQHLEQLRGWIAAVPDLTLKQLKEKLLEEQGVAISQVQVARALKKMGLRLKKSRSTPRNGTERRTSGGEKSSLPGSARSLRKG